MSAVVFRADASSQIGTGHVMRCLTLADALRDQGCKCRFVCREHPGNLLELIRQRGYAAHALPAVEQHDSKVGSGDYPPEHADWLGVDWQTDADQTRAAIVDRRVDWLIIDHYALDARWERLLRPACGKLMVIDDLADRDHDCDVLLDQNVLPEANRRYLGRVPLKCQMLLGPEYILLRPGFVRLARDTSARTGGLRRGLIAFAGSDSADLTSAAIAAVAGTLPNAAGMDVLISNQHAARLAIADACKALGFDLHVQVADPAPLMARADLAISASGFVSYELAAMGVPALLVPISPIQRAVAGVLAASGASRLLEFAEPQRRVSRFRNAWISLVQDDARRAAMSQAGSKLIDANGTARVMQSMLAVTH